MATVRLQKVLARAGVASRRAAEEMISAGRVRVDGRVVTELGTKIEPRRSRVEVDGTRIVREAPVYVVLHKPRGVVSTMSDPQGRPCIRELLADVHSRVFPVGRLDYNTSGVLLATNDGEFTDALLHPRLAVPKTYVVKVNGVMETTDLDVWRRGVELEDGKTQPAKVKLLRHEGDKTWLELTITEGRNQQVRRMGEVTGFRVMRLARIEFAGIKSDALPPGRWRYATGDELKDLKKAYGVPKRIVSPPAGPVSAKGADRTASLSAGTALDAHGRAQPVHRDRDHRPAARAEGASGADRRSDRNAVPHRGRPRPEPALPRGRGPKPASEKTRATSPARRTPRPGGSRRTT